MRVVVATTAGAGHFGPLLPFAGALRTAGHDVVVAAPASFSTAVARAGYEHRPFADGDPAAQGAVFASLGGLSHRTANELVASEVFARIDGNAALPGVRALVDEWRPDLIVRESCEFASYVVAENRGVPHVQVAVGLESFETLFFSVVDPPLREMGAAAGVDGLRAAPRLSLLPPSLEGAGASATRRFRDPAAGGADRAPLPDWWSGSTAPLVYVTFGSVAASLDLFPGFYRGVVAAIADLPIRVLLTVGEAGDPEALGALPPSVHVERWWPQAQVMGHASAMVGHGGFGTTLAGLAAGVPMVVVPLFADQPDNARRVEEVGAGLALEGGADALGGLGPALARVLGDGSYREAARRVADEIADLPPASDAVPWLEDIAAGGAG